MVHGWIRDVTQYQNVFADCQIIHFYRLDTFVYFFAISHNIYNT